MGVKFKAGDKVYILPYHTPGVVDAIIGAYWIGVWLGPNGRDADYLLREPYKIVNPIELELR